MASIDNDRPRFKGCNVLGPFSVRRISMATSEKVLKDVGRIERLSFSVLNEMSSAYSCTIRSLIPMYPLVMTPLGRAHPNYQKSSPGCLPSVRHNLHTSLVSLTHSSRLVYRCERILSRNLGMPKPDMSGFPAADVAAWNRHNQIPLEQIFAPTCNGGLEIGPRPPFLRGTVPGKAKPPPADGWSSLRPQEHSLFVTIRDSSPGPQTKAAYDMYEPQLRRAFAQAMANPPPRPLTRLQHQLYEALYQEVQRRGITLDATPGPITSVAQPPHAAQQIQHTRMFPGMLTQEELHGKQDKAREERAKLIAMARAAASPEAPRIRHQPNKAAPQVFNPDASTRVPAPSVPPAALWERKVQQIEDLDHKQRQIERDALAQKFAQEAQHRQYDTWQYDAQRAALEQHRQNFARAAAQANTDRQPESFHENDIRVVEWYSAGGPGARSQGPEDATWIEILKKVRSQPGCDAVARWPAAGASETSSRVAVVGKHKIGFIPKSMDLVADS